ncbi:P-loop containing nucleoside triphosphate hydrolase protein [Hypoxylon rubiginosum]|uniref:P-loop containing nucleoside triphosphate hydrolase protein n=1 Tax=Hypoxylon rubiginosum TaxID=110542 RepID=A0ACC0DFE9_9PEZI|nr:P-loop containing nucleoside triphosphate hydrolase protein [Hypoxylon rubiginosum]
MRVFLRTGSASSSCAVLVSRNAFSTFSAACRFSRAHPNAFVRSGLKDGPPVWAKNRDNNVSSTKQVQQEATKTYGIFRNLALGRYDLLMSTSRSWAAKGEEYKSFGVNSKLDLDREVKLFRNSIERACDLASEKHAVSRSENPLFWTLRNAFVEGDVSALGEEIVFSFQNFLMRSRFPKNIAATHKEIADFRYPYEWFPATRALQRTIHLHVGPTNSGKTYNALKALENAKSGIYAGPLRLLAHEVYMRFLAKGIKCALITGEEQRIPENEDNYFRSCTVEMTPLNQPVDVAVIDEIQMIGDSERGWAWTQAFLGVQAKEVHLCGEERTVELIQSLCATIGDKCVINRYNRLSPLECMSESLHGTWKNLQKGDAIVSFSRVGIHAIKKQIENITGRRCAIVYGSLPPETRAQQAALFNDPDNDYDFLVASDAIGMGLNLEIKRIVFEQTHKRTKGGFRVLTTPELKQIGGRAGRYRTARQAATSGSDTNEQGTIPATRTGQLGLVTAIEDDDLSIVREAFTREPEPIKTAGIQPPSSVLERFSSYFPPNTPFSYIIARLRDIARTSSRFHLCYLGEMLAIADLIQPFPMSVYDRCVFLNAPVFLRESSGALVVQAFAKCVSTMDGGDLLDIPEVDLELLDMNEEEFRYDSAELLRRLESLHKTITLYLWLSYRYSGVFRSQNLAFHIKELVEARIDACLSKVNVDAQQRRAYMQFTRKQAMESKRQKNKVLGEETTVDDPKHELSGEWNEEGHEEPLFSDAGELRPITRLEPNSNKARPNRNHRDHTRANR